MILNFIFKNAIIQLVIVCHCRGVTERKIRQAVRKGACSRVDVARACDAGRTCGGCTPVIDDILESERGPEAAHAASLSEPAFAAR